MAGYRLAVGVLLALCGSALIAWPRRVWRFTRGWRFADPEAVRLADAYLSWRRLSGAVAGGPTDPSVALRGRRHPVAAGTAPPCPTPTPGPPQGVGACAYGTVHMPTSAVAGYRPGAPPSARATGECSSSTRTRKS